MDVLNNILIEIKATARTRKLRAPTTALGMNYLLVSGLPCRHDPKAVTPAMSQPKAPKWLGGVARAGALWARCWWGKYRKNKGPDVTKAPEGALNLSASMTCHRPLLGWLRGTDLCAVSSA